MYRVKNTAGYSFVEVLVSIAILLVAIVGPLTIVATGLKNATFAREQSVAFFLAQEGLEGIIYLRETAALGQLPSGTNTWGWASSLPSACFSGSPCRIEIATHTVSECSPVSECDLNLHSSGDVRYRHQAGGQDTIFSRKLYFTNVSGGGLRVRSVVEWHANAFGGTRSVELESYLYDVYGE